ncbi:MAG: beta-lactamase family protein [Clostridia bacterium]|nr:beta-lactamase family protein [Clostridia bacterium]
MSIGFSSSIEARAYDNIKKGLMPGAAVSVINEKGLIYENCFGVCDIEKRNPIEENSLFRLASMTKPITAVALLICEERGLLSIDDPVCKYLPSLSKMTIGDVDAEGKIISRHEAKGVPTIKNILNHTGGLGQGFAGLNSFNEVFELKDGIRLCDAVPRFNEICLDFEPGTLCGYTTTLGFDCAAHIVEIVSGMDIEDFLKKELFDKLETNGLLYTPSEDDKNRTVTLYDTVGGALIKKDITGCNFEPYPISYKAAGCGMLGSLSGYTAFVSMLLNGGVYNGSRILSEESVKKASTVSVPDNLNRFFPHEKWGLAMRVITDIVPGEQELPVGCYGWSGAYGCHFFIDPKRKLAAVFMKNVANAGGATAPTAREFEADVLKDFYK